MNIFVRLSMCLGAICLGIVASIFMVVLSFVDHNRWLKTAIALDQAFNASTGGDENLTLSTRAARARIAGKRWGCVLCWVLDKIDPKHCEDSDMKNV